MLLFSCSNNLTQNILYYNPLINYCVKFMFWRVGSMEVIRVTFETNKIVYPSILIAIESKSK